MPPVAIALIVILAVHYFLAVATLFILLKDKGVTKAIIPWNLVILLLPVAGPCAYWIYRTFFRRKPGSAAPEAEDGAVKDASAEDGGTEREEK